MAGNAASNRYAKALFELAREDSRIDEVRAELRALGAALETSPELGNVLLQPLYPAAERRAVLAGVVEKLEASPILRSFYSFLIDQRRLVDLAGIEGEYGRLADQAAGITVAKVRTATPLTEEQQGRLQRALAQKTGRNVTLDVEVDADLLGGLVAQIGDTIFDGSLKTQLHQLRSGIAK